MPILIGSAAPTDLGSTGATVAAAVAWINLRRETAELLVI
jgi:hypothetical protein